MSKKNKVINADLYEAIESIGEVLVLIVRV